MSVRWGGKGRSREQWHAWIIVILFLVWAAASGYIDVWTWLTHV